ncbi:MAG TPA: hypothetical protein VFU21_24150 [Kofleriaceae bacterium]|nr:hypothetical protein [Kofleriaceae bacterium]
MRGSFLALMCFLVPRVAAAQPGGETAAEAAAPAPEEPRSYWLEVFGEHYPTRDEQQSVYTGGRLLLRLSGLTRLVLDGGYVAAGREAGDGDDGLAVGVGLETLLSDRGSWHPFVRIKLDHVVKQTSDLPTGTLDTNAAMVSAGVRLRDAVDLHASAGKSYSGDLSLGVGLAFGLRL